MGGDIDVISYLHSADPPLEPDKSSESNSVAAVAGALGSVMAMLLFLGIAIIAGVVAYRALQKR